MSIERCLIDSLINLADRAKVNPMRHHRPKEPCTIRRMCFSPAFAAASLVLMLTWGCDMLGQEVPPEKLPPVPEKCRPLSDEHRDAVIAATSSVKASQTQISFIANRFAQCMQDEGLSRAEAKGLIKKNEAEARQAGEKSGGSEFDLVR